MERVITDNFGERIVLKWDGERFYLIQENKGSPRAVITTTIILNPQEANDLVYFIREVQGNVREVHLPRQTELLSD